MKCVICPDPFCKIDMKKFEKADLVVGSLKEVTEELIEEL